MGMLLKHSSHFGPVTSLCFNGEVLYVGQGSKIKTYDWKSGELKSKLDVFARNKIHGIQCSKQRMVIWGERSIGLLKINEDSTPSILKIGQVNDWITVAEFREDRVIAMTAHNLVVVIDFSTASVLDTVSCSENSILYSGTILPNSPLVAAGTVLHGVVVWNMDTGQVMHELTSHEGSIFGVQFSGNGKRLVSCSDDRSIRLWSLENGEELGVGWGHTSRIWNLRFLGDKYVLSTSEDCTARLWRIEDDKVEIVKVFEGHHGRNAWCVAIHESGIVATGGNDGRICLWNTGDIQGETRTWSAVDLPEQPKGVAFKNYAAIKGTLVVATSNGQLFCLDTRNTVNKWLRVEGATLDGHSLIRPAGKNVCICTRDGDLYILDSSRRTIRVKTTLNLKGKVYDIITCGSDESWYVLAITQNPNDCVLVYDVNGGSLVARLTLPSTFVPTSAVYACATKCLILGSRYGAVASYKIDLCKHDGENQHPENVYRRLMSDDTITASEIIRDNEQCATIIFTSRAGHYATVALGPLGDISVLSSNRFTKGSIEKVVICDGGRMAFVGFRNDYLFVWDVGNEIELMSERCGGPHRTWFIDLQASDSNSQCHNIWNYSFYYTKVSDIHLVSSLPQKIQYHAALLQSGTHGREIRGVAFHPKSYPNFHVVATGAEDTTVRFSTLRRDGALVTSSSHSNHVSGIQSLQWTKDGRYLLTSAAREELFFWKVNVDEELHNVNAYVAAVLPVVSDVPDLRIMAIDTITLCDGAYLLATAYSNSTVRIWQVEFRQETKFHLIGSATYTHCCLLNANFVLQGSHAFTIFSGTDGNLVGWNIDNMLRMNGIKCENGVLVASAGAALQLVPLGEYLTRLQVHQSGVKDCFLIDSGGPSHSILVSCGDDNAIAVSAVSIDGPDIYIKKLASEHSAHSTAITGIQHLDNRLFTTISTDQNVKIWRIGDHNIPELLENHYTTIADTGVIDSTPIDGGHLIAIGGSGLSFSEYTL